MVNWVSTMISMFLVDRVPRPKFLAFDLIMCASCLIVEAALVKNFVDSHVNNPYALKAALAVLFLFGAFFNIGLDATQFTYISEIFPSYLRAKGTAIGTLVCPTDLCHYAHTDLTHGVPMANLVWLEIAPVAFANIGWRTYLIFVCVGGVGAIVLFFFYPDTKGIPLEEIAAIFGDANEVAVYQKELEENSEVVNVGILSKDKSPKDQTTEHIEGENPHVGA
jgi:MFS family permease